MATHITVDDPKLRRRDWTALEEMIRRVVREVLVEVLAKPEQTSEQLGGYDGATPVVEIDGEPYPEERRSPSPIGFETGSKVVPSA